MLHDVTILDLLAAGIVFFSVAVAFNKGLTVELISLGATICAIVLAFFFYLDAAGLLRRIGLGGAAPDFIGFLLVFLATVALGSLLAVAVDRSLRHLHLKWIDRFLGAAFGLLRGCLIAMIVFIALTAFQVRQDLLARSILAEFFLTGAQLVTVVAPPDFRQRFAAGYAWVYDLWLKETAAAND